MYKLNGDKKEGVKTLHEIEMTSVDKTRPFHKVFVFTDKAAKILYSVRVLEKSGNQYRYIINSLNPSANLTDADFVFFTRKNSGVKVIDLRKKNYLRN